MVSGMQQLRMNTAGLSTLPESPSQMGTGEGVFTTATLQHRGSIKRSPLGRSVVTALEAELNQVLTCHYEIGSTAKALANCKLQYYRLSECIC